MKKIIGIVALSFLLVGAGCIKQPTIGTPLANPDVFNKQQPLTTDPESEETFEESFSDKNSEEIINQIDKDIADIENQSSQNKLVTFIPEKEQFQTVKGTITGTLQSKEKQTGRIMYTSGSEVGKNIRTFYFKDGKLILSRIETQGFEDGKQIESTVAISYVNDNELVFYKHTVEGKSAKTFEEDRKDFPLSETTEKKKFKDYLLSEAEDYLSQVVSNM